MKRLVIIALFSSSGLYASANSLLPTSVPSNSRGIRVILPGGTTQNLGVPNPQEFAPSVYPGGVDFDFGDSDTPGFARNPADATSSYFAMVKDSSNRLVVCGFAPLTGPGGAKRWVVARYTSAGVLDTSFNTVGYNQEDAFNLSEARGLAIDSSGNIVVCGYSTQSSVVTWTVARYTSSGVRDTTFNSTGTSPGAIFETELGIGTAYSVSIGATGLLYVGGYTTPASVSVITTISYDSTGARNAAYNP